MLKYISLFSGIGAFEKALFNIGVPYELINYCEIDKYASKAYSLIHHIPESRNLWDITKVDETTYGIPQSRERVIIVSIRKDIDNGSFQFPDPIPLTRCLADMLEDDVPEAFYLSEDKTRSVISHNDKHPGHIADRGGICPTLLSRDCKDPKVIIVPMKIIQAADLNHYGNDQMNRIYSPEGLAPTLKTVSGGDVR